MTPRHEQSAAVERTQTTLAQVRRQHVELRTFGQLEETDIAVEMFLVVAFQQTCAGQLATRFSNEPTQTSQGRAEQETAEDPVSNVELDKVQQFRRRFV